MNEATPKTLRAVFVADERVRYCGLYTGAQCELPNGQVVPPARFMSVAESSGVITQLGEFVLRTACSFTHSLQLEQLPGLRISVNVSRRQVLDPEFPQTVARVLEETGLAPEYLDLELGEGEAAHDLDGVASALARVRELATINEILAYLLLAARVTITPLAPSDNFTASASSHIRDRPPT